MTTSSPPDAGPPSLGDFPATRADGLRRLAAFVPRAGRAYAEGRNADLYDRDVGPAARTNVSMLSRYLRYRLVSEREVVAAVIGRHGAGAAEKFIQEVLWRTYWKGWLELRPDVWTRFITERDATRADAKGGLTRAVGQAEAGATGIEGFDDWARELVATGYMHNHARMWFASIWIFTLRLPWVLGADFFLRHLVDADLASNTLSWRWVAGLQTRGKTYLATADNIARYTDGRYRPTGLATRAQALDEPPLPKPRALPDAGTARVAAPALLLVSGEDLSPETLFDAGAGVSAVVVARGAGAAWPFGDKARAFLTDAADDAAARARGHFACPASVVDALDAEAIIAAARAAGVRDVVTATAPVGPVADALAALDAALPAAGLALTRRRRAWDERFWPHATKGYFAFKERIADALAEEGLDGFGDVSRA